jgi:hypothetical protein
LAIGFPELLFVRRWQMIGALQFGMIRESGQRQDLTSPFLDECKKFLSKGKT